MLLHVRGRVGVRALCLEVRLSVGVNLISSQVINAQALLTEATLVRVPPGIIRTTVLTLHWPLA